MNDLEISEKIEALESELGRTTDHYDRRELEYLIEELQDELHQGYREECVAMGEHNKRIIPSGGYDVCFNCGAKQ